MKLYHDVPSSQGMENALKRAKQLAEFPWTPVKAIAAGNIFIDDCGVKRNIDTFLGPWRPQIGAIYSSVRLHEKFIGFNVSFETYVTALANPDSVLYTKPQHGLGRSMYAYYGTVCSSFVSYVCDLPFRVPCSRWPAYPGISPVDASRLENLQLCDIVLNVKSHIAIITGIQRDATGVVRAITVSESTPPVCITATFTAEEFRNHWLGRGFEIFRYAGIHDVSYTPSPYIPLEGDPCLERPRMNRTLMADFGNKANYMLGETVKLSVFEPDWTAVRISGPVSETLPIENGAAVFSPEKPGYYRALCVNGEQESEAVEFCVTAIDVQVDASSEIASMTFACAAPEDECLGWIVQDEKHFLRGRGEFTAEDLATGRAALEKLAPGRYYVFVLARNRFGIYKSEGAAFLIG